MNSDQLEFEMCTTYGLTIPYSYIAWYIASKENNKRERKLETFSKIMRRRRRKKGSNLFKKEKTIFL